MDRPIPARAECRLSDRAIPSRAEKKKHKEPKIRNSFRRESSSRRESKRDSLSTRNLNSRHSRTRRKLKKQEEKEKGYSQSTSKSVPTKDHPSVMKISDAIQALLQSKKRLIIARVKAGRKAKDLPIPTQFTT
eukprot:UN19491